jgi:myo-inositol-1-phosphate synthase
MALNNKTDIKPAEGKLGVLLVGLGAVSTTFVAGVEAVKKGFAKPIGSLTQMGTIRLGKRTDNRVPLIKDFVPLADLKDMVFGAWDIFRVCLRRGFECRGAREGTFEPTQGTPPKTQTHESGF